MTKASSVVSPHLWYLCKRLPHISILVGEGSMVIYRKLSLRVERTGSRGSPYRWIYIWGRELVIWELVTVRLRRMTRRQTKRIILRILTGVTLEGSNWCSCSTVPQSRCPVARSVRDSVMVVSNEMVRVQAKC